MTAPVFLFRNSEDPMKAQTLIRYLIGYLTGIFVFIVAIPCSLFYLSNGTYAFPLPIANPVHFICTLILGSVGLAFLAWSNAALLLQGKGGPADVLNVAISPRTEHLVIKGPYRFTRNPMVFGAFALYFSLAIYWKSLAALLVLIVFYIAAHFYLRMTEEKRLLRDFGQEYEDYRKQVPMIAPWPFHIPLFNQKPLRFNDWHYFMPDHYSDGKHRSIFRAIHQSGQTLRAGAGKFISLLCYLRLNHNGSSYSNWRSAARRDHYQNR
jgi:protein-S-isoprenylcysteine O-methyltransferase Ste14